MVQRVLETAAGAPTVSERLLHQEFILGYKTFERRRRVATRPTIHRNPFSRSIASAQAASDGSSGGTGSER
jgi:hypothetical protein